MLRQQTTTSLAMGELFVNRNEWLPLVSERLIDFIRIHQSAAGGLNQCRKIAACCEFFNVRTAWQCMVEKRKAEEIRKSAFSLAVAGSTFGAMGAGLLSMRTIEITSPANITQRTTR